MIMRFFKSLQGLGEPRSLPEWLGMATWGLLPSAQDRVRPEIKAHYAEAVQFHLNNGLSESAAQTAALAELGSPKAASRRFRRKHLTIFDHSAIEGYFSLGMNFFVTGGSFLLALLVLKIASSPKGFKQESLEAVFLLALGLSVFAARLASFLITRQAPTIARLRRLLLFISLPHLLVPIYPLAVISWAMYDYPTHANKDFFDLNLFESLMMVWVIADNTVSFRRKLLLRKKLGSASEEDLLPLNPASS